MHQKILLALIFVVSISPAWASDVEFLSRIVSTRFPGKSPEDVDTIVRGALLPRVQSGDPEYAIPESGDGDWHIYTPSYIKEWLVDRLCDRRKHGVGHSHKCAARVALNKYLTGPYSLAQSEALAVIWVDLANRYPLMEKRVIKTMAAYCYRDRDRGQQLPEYLLAHLATSVAKLIPGCLDIDQIDFSDPVNRSYFLHQVLREKRSVSETLRFYYVFLEWSRLQLTETQLAHLLQFSHGMWKPDATPQQLLKNYLMVRAGLGLSQAATAGVDLIYNQGCNLADVMHVHRRQFLKRQWPGFSQAEVMRFADFLEDRFKGNNKNSSEYNGLVKRFDDRDAFYTDEDDFIRDATLESFLTNHKSMTEIKYVSRYLKKGFLLEESKSRGLHAYRFFRKNDFRGFMQNCPPEFLYLAAEAAYDGANNLEAFRQAVERFFEVPDEYIAQDARLREMFYDGIYQHILGAQQWPGEAIAYIKKKRIMSEQHTLWKMAEAFVKHMGLNLIHDNPVDTWKAYFQEWLWDNFLETKVAEDMLRQMRALTLIKIFTHGLGSEYDYFFYENHDRANYMDTFAEMFSQIDLPAWNCAFGNESIHVEHRQRLKWYIAGLMLLNKTKSLPEAVEICRQKKDMFEKAVKKNLPRATKEEIERETWRVLLAPVPVAPMDESDDESDSDEPMLDAVPMPIAHDPETLLAGKLLNVTWPQGKPCPRPVLDIDDTLCGKIRESYLDHLRIYNNEPEAILIPFRHVEGSFAHMFFPHIGEMMLAMLSWGWNIDVMSHGAAVRNEAVIPLYLKVMLGSYFRDPTSIVDKLMATRVRIFSRHHMIEPDRQTYVPARFEEVGNMKKDLKALGLPMEDVLLVDDDSSYVTGEDQIFHLKLRSSATSDYERVAYREPNQTVDGFGKKSRNNAADNAPFILGAFAVCRDRMGEEGRLRPSMQALRMMPDADWQIKKSQAKGKDIPQWSLACPYDLNRSEWEALPDFEREQVIAFVARGREGISLIKQFRQYPLPSQRGADPFGDLTKEVYGNKINKNSN